MTTKFKAYEQHQGHLFPPYLDELIDEKDLVRVVSNVLDEVSSDALEAPFKKEGSPAYNPRMMLKVLVYSYSRQIYSCRQIAAALRRDVCFMWLAGMQQPDFRTINRFRGEYFKEILPQVLSDLCEFLMAKNFIQSSDYFVDGTKMEADASRHSHIWKKNTLRYKAKVLERAKEILTEIADLNKAEDETLGASDLLERGTHTQITVDQLKAVANNINGALEGKTATKQNRKQKSRANRLEKEAQKLAKYEEQEQILEDRNSYSKTDLDGTFMRMKNSDELRAGYNLQMGTQDGFITGCTVHQQPNDGVTLIEHIEEREQLGLPAVKNIMGDAGYGYEQNYMELEKRGIEAYLKYPDFHRELNGKHGPYHWSRFIYDEKEDCFECPNHRMLRFRESRERIRYNNYYSLMRRYECESCEGCPFKKECTRSDGPRTIAYTPQLVAYRKQARARLTSEKGLELRSQRGHAIETVFGDLKHNRKARRYHLRGLLKVKAESILMALAYNLRRLFGRLGPKMG